MKYRLAEYENQIRQLKEFLRETEDEYQKLNTYVTVSFYDTWPLNLDLMDYTIQLLEFVKKYRNAPKDIREQIDALLVMATLVNEGGK